MQSDIPALSGRLVSVSYIKKERKYLDKKAEENIWRRKIFGEGRGRGTEKEKEENILEKKSDDGQTDMYTRTEFLLIDE